MLEDRYFRGGKFEDIRTREDAPVEDAVAMIVREKLTGLAPPPAAAKLVDLWRPWIEEKAGKDLTRLDRVIENQRAFAKTVNDLLAHLGMADLSDADRAGRRRQRDRRRPGPGERGPGRREPDRRPVAGDAPRGGRIGRRRQRGGRGAGSRVAVLRHAGGERDRRRRGGQPALAAAGQPRQRAPGPRLQGLLDPVRRGRRRSRPLRSGGARPPARLSRQAARLAVGRRRRASPTGCSAA